MKKESIADFVAEQEAATIRAAEAEAKRKMVDKLSREESATNFDIILRLLEACASKSPFDYEVKQRGDVCNVRSKTDRRAMQVYLQDTNLCASYEGERRTSTIEFKGLVTPTGNSGVAKFSWVAGDEQTHFTNQELVEAVLVKMARLQVR